MTSKEEGEVVGQGRDMIQQQLIEEWNHNHQSSLHEDGKQYMDGLPLIFGRGHHSRDQTKLQSRAHPARWRQLYKHFSVTMTPFHRTSVS